MTMPNGVASVLAASVDAEPECTAIAMAGARAAFRTGGLHADPPRTLLREINWLANENRGKCVLSAVNLALNPKSGAMEFCTAGPIGALVLNAGGEVRDLADPPADCLGRGNPIDPPRRNDTLRNGEVLALFTPGCTSMQDSSGREIGRDRFVEALKDVFGAPPSTMLEDLQHELGGFFRDGHQQDDITVLLLHRP
jgi:serine phosphatase RsbU (regulator of sigma subunit)